VVLGLALDTHRFRHLRRKPCVMRLSTGRVTWPCQSRARLTWPQLLEPPGADPHAGWFDRGAAKRCPLCRS